MTAAELRARVEDQGGSFVIVAGHLRCFARRSVLDQVRAELHHHRAALVTLVKSYPCRGCGRDPNVTPLKCRRCATLAASPIIGASGRRSFPEER